MLIQKYGNPIAAVYIIKVVPYSARWPPNKFEKLLREETFRFCNLLIVGKPLHIPEKSI